MLSILIQMLFFLINLKVRKIIGKKEEKSEVPERPFLRTYPGIPFSMMKAVIPLDPAEGSVFA